MHALHDIAIILLVVLHDCTVEEFCTEKKLDLSHNNWSILLEFSRVDKSNIVKGSQRDVILMDKVLK